MPSQLSSIVGLVGLVRSQPAPIVFLDTCAILDIPRSFYRELASSSLVQMALKAIQASSATLPKLHLLAPEKVTLEYAKNLPEAIQGLQDRILHFSEISRSLSTAQDSAQLVSGLATIGKELAALTDRIYQSSLSIATEQSCLSSAAQRRATGTAPGTRGSSNDADCIIVEHVLEFVRQLRAVGVQQPCIFVSSNHKDFGRAPIAKSPLDSEFGALSIDYMADIATAMAHTGLP